jgi:hypothetical protein
VQHSSRKDIQFHESRSRLPVADLLLLLVRCLFSQIYLSLVPQLEEMAEKMQDRVRIVKIDTDDYAECTLGFLRLYRTSG